MFKLVATGREATLDRANVPPEGGPSMRFVLPVTLIVLCSAIAGRAAAGSEAAWTSAAAYSERAGGLALVACVDGRVVFERYAGGASASTPLRIYSGTKGFWTIAALKAEEQGILDLEEPASRTLSEWRGTLRETITLRQLLAMVSGLAPLPQLHQSSIANRNALALQAPLLSTPGTAFHYGPAPLQAFEEVLRRKLRWPSGADSIAFLKKTLLDPAGLPLRRCLTDRKGRPLLATGFTLTAREWMRWGECLRLRGRFTFQNVFPGSAIDEATRGSGPNPMFGLGFWNNSGARSSSPREMNIEQHLGDAHWPRGACISTVAPSDLFASVGSAGQRLYVIPSRRMVIVRMGETTGFSDARFLGMLFGR